MERTRNDGFIDKIVKFYQIEGESKGTFFLQVDWLLENAVYPLESGYADNLLDLWNVYMPGYKFDGVVLEYSKRYFPVLRFVHDGEIFKFNSIKIMQECAVKNYLKYLISQGQTNRMTLVKDCFDLFKDITDRTRLYDIINQTIENYFVNGEIEQCSVMFLKKFQDYFEQPYIDIVERLADIHEQKQQALEARSNLLKTLKVQKRDVEEVGTLINILLCRIALADGESRFSDVLEDMWNKTVSSVTYTDLIYSFIEKYEKPYMNAACFGIKNIKDGKVIKQLYKDAVILCAVLQSIEKGNRYGIKDVYKFWKQDGMHFAGGYFFDDEFERMKYAFNSDILISHKDDILAFHNILIEKIHTVGFQSSSNNAIFREKRSSALEMDHVALNEKDRQIEELQERISELEEKVDNTEKEVLSQFISLLDSKKYDHVLGKLYRMAYIERTMRIEDIQRILKNLFEIMNISGIDVYGKLEIEVSGDEIRRGKYRVDHEITKEAKLKYPGYRIGNSVILHPLAEEV